MTDLADTYGGMDLVANVKKIMEERGIKAAELSRMTGIAPPRLSRWFAGDGTPTVEQAHRLATAIGTTVDALLGDRAEPPLSEAERAAVDIVRALGLTKEQAIRRLSAAPDVPRAVDPRPEWAPQPIPKPAESDQAKGRRKLS